MNIIIFDKNGCGGGKMLIHKMWIICRVFFVGTLPLEMSVQYINIQCRVCSVKPGICDDVSIQGGQDTWVRVAGAGGSCLASGINCSSQSWPRQV